MSVLSCESCLYVTKRGRVRLSEIHSVLRRRTHAAEYGVVFDYIRDSWGMSTDATKPFCLWEFK